MDAPKTRVRLRVSPGARRAGVVGRHGEAWKLRVTPPAEGGRANAAVAHLLSDALHIGRADVSLLSGHAGRDKVVEVTGIVPAEAERLLTAASTKNGRGGGSP